MKKKSKSNLDLKISERDRALLWMLASVMTIVLAYFLGYSKLNEKVISVEQQVSAAQSKNRQLIAMTADKRKYEEGVTSYNNQFNAVIAGYENGVSQDASLMYLNRIEQITGIWIKSTTFASVSPIYTFGQIASTNPAAAGGQAYTTDLQGYKTTLTLAYEAAYGQWKELISYVNNYYSKNTIENISMSYDVENNMVTGTMTLSTYCITGSKRIYKLPEYSTPFGTDNIFSSKFFTPVVPVQADADGSSILSDYDYYMLLNSAASDMDSCIIGEKDDDGSKLLSVNDNSVQEVTVRFAGREGNYTVQYAINGKTFPASGYEAGAAFLPGARLDFLIMSTPRVSAEDKSGASITLVNDTDLDLNVKVCNDDKANPRVTFKSRTGIINVYH